MAIRRPLLVVLAGAALLGTACGADRLQFSPDSATTAEPAAQSPGGMADMPGMSNMPAATAAADTTPHLPPAAKLINTRSGHDVTVSLTTERKDIEIAPGVVYHAWTFSGSVPGPVIRVTEGDTVHVSVTNTDTAGMGHSIDFHAAQVAPDKDYNEIPAGTTKTFDFVANHPGVFMYHCGSPMIIQHMANGMYGAIIVDPKGGRPAAREYVLVQSEFYTAGDAKQLMQDENTGNAQYVVFNGYQNHYKLQPLTANPGEPIRLYVVDAGPNHWSAFHVVGGIFSSMQASGNPANQLQWVQTGTVAPGDGAVFELTIPDAGTYPVVTHSFGDVDQGAVGVIKVAPGSAPQPLLP
jgi:nitrite reductase (NO-forming)